MTTTVQTPPAAPNGRAKKLIIAAAVFGALALGYGLYYTTYGQYHEETDDAYVGANLVYVNAQVSGTVVGLGADDNQPVKAGEPLIRLDHADATVALADAEGRLGEIVRQIRQQFRSVDESSAVVAQRKTDLARAQDDLARRKQLAGSEALSAEDLAHANEAVAAARDALTVAEKQLAATRVPIDGTTLRHQPSVLRARAAYVQAYLAAQRNDIVAPVDGFVARRTVQVGQRVSPGASLLAVVPLKGAWVDANFKEPQLRNLRIGQPATVSADLYGGHVEYHGKVASISAGSGGAFSLLPPQNATGNWIKVVQRVPVRIALDPEELKAHPLRAGLSTVVVVDTHNRDGQVDTALPLPNAALNTTVFDEQLKVAEARADAIIAQQAGHDE
ncbi:MAG: HlyD family efflux transporter periplasmic adaptor subunit [Burkholderiales bacterium]|nr:HlyD family efflux transporter periplasmic adaptor subunit [Burkholderiales bacterium]